MNSDSCETSGDVCYPGNCPIPEYIERGPDYATFRLLTERLGEVEDLLYRQNKELIHQMRESAKRESRLTALLDQCPLGVMITFNRVIEYANRRIEDITGYKRSELIGSSTKLFYPTEAEWTRVGEIQKNSSEGRVKSTLRRKDGTHVDCLVKMTRVIEGINEFIVTIYLEGDCFNGS